MLNRNMQYKCAPKGLLRSDPAVGLSCTHIFYMEKIEHSLSRKAGDNTD
jgi:hypothetical protein